MGIDKGSSATAKGGDRCAACHKKKAGAAAITQIKNQGAVKQNTSTVLNVWRPK
jgi:hypothetical protein